MLSHKKNTQSGGETCAPYLPPFKLNDEQLRDKISCMNSMITGIENDRAPYIRLAAKFETTKKNRKLTEKEQNDYDDVLEYLIRTQETLDSAKEYLGDCEDAKNKRDGGTTASLNSNEYQNSTNEIQKKIHEGYTANTLLKPPHDWTEAELKDVMKQREQASFQEKQDMMQRERQWFDHMYGNQPVEFDETGRMVQPKPIRSIPVMPRPIQTPDGQELEDAIEDIIGRLPIEGPVVPGQPEMEKPPFEDVRPMQAKNEGDMVKAMQSGLNILSNKQNQSPLPNSSKMAKLKEDGDLGPKTSFALKKALVDNGAPKVSEALALGQFKEIVKKTKKDGPQNLAGDLAATFSPLLPKKKSPKETFQSEGLALQDTLNDFGADLKDDGIVGPKTEEAFNNIAKTVDEDDLVNQFGSNLGFSF